MRLFWRIFWFLRLFANAGMTYWAWTVRDNQKALLQIMMLITVWTMWTSDLPDGKEE